MFCTRCGQQNPADALFCSRCGSALSRTPEVPGEGGDPSSTMLFGALDVEPVGEEIEESLAAAEGLPAGTALLVVRRGPNAGSRFLLDKDVTTAGRHPESDIFLDDVTVSRRHAEFRRTPEGTFRVADVGSLNGTYLNRTRIDRADLTGGDEVQVGKFRLVFLAGPRPAASPPPAPRSEETGDAAGSERGAGGEAR